jgi:hypothetical protein
MICKTVACSQPEISFKGKPELFGDSSSCFTNRHGRTGRGGGGGGGGGGVAAWQYWLIIKINGTNSVNFVGNSVNFVGNMLSNRNFSTTRAQSEKVGQISFRPPNFFLPVRPCKSPTPLLPSRRKASAQNV